MLGTFDIGDKPKFALKVMDDTGALNDPGTLKFITRNPAGVETVYVYSVAPEVSKTATGTYVFQMPQIVAGQNGTWSLRANGSVSVVSSFEDIFVVSASSFSTPLP